MLRKYDIPFTLLCMNDATFIKKMNETIKRTGYRVSEIGKRIGYSPEVVRQALNGSRPLSAKLRERLEEFKHELDKMNIGGGGDLPPAA